MKSRPLVSIVLPTYNGSRYLARSVESCMEQTYSHWELIIVDDCSTDDTPRIIEQYTRKDTRIRAVRNERNRRLPGSLNRGFAEARGDYLTWTSDDNYYLPEALSVMVYFLNSHPDIGMVYTDYTVVDRDGAVLRYVESPDVEQLVVKNIVGASFLYRREVKEVVGNYAEELVLVEDYDYWLRVASHFRLAPLRQNLYAYMMHEASLTSLNRREVIREARDRALAKNLPHLRWVSRTVKAQRFMQLARSARQRQDWRSAYRLFLRAGLYSPFLFIRFSVGRLVTGFLRPIKVVTGRMR
jgi:glycosyltransferase involved in cell wall biosynthesis